jgi:hypothetical protein
VADGTAGDTVHVHIRTKVKPLKQLMWRMGLQVTHMSTQ